MAYTTIDNPTKFFNTLLYTGDMVDGDGTGHTQSITGVGFQPDWVWHKGRSNARQHMIVDSVRGLTNYNFISSQDTNAAATVNTNGAIKSIDSDGITVENGTDSSAKANNAGANGENYVTWNWLAGTTGSGNSTGSGTAKPYSYSVNTTSGFSIVKYTGNGTSGQRIPHHLGVVPKAIIQRRTSTAAGWNVYNHTLGLNYIMLNNTNASASDSGKFNADPTSTYIQIGNDAGMNTNDGSHLFYCFAEKQGYSKFGKYKGNGNADGTFVYTGFRPAWVMFKGNNTSNWQLWDDKRDPINPVEKAMHPDIGNVASTDQDIDFLSNGFKIRGSVAHINGDGVDFYYLAFAESPFVNSNGVPNNAR